MHLSDAAVLFIILVAMVSLLLVLLHRTRLGSLLHEHIADRPRRRLFLASVSFFLTFAIVRGMVFCIRHQIPPFHYVVMGGRHIHHLVPGILILLAVGYGLVTGRGAKPVDQAQCARVFGGVVYEDQPVRRGWGRQGRRRW